MERHLPTGNCINIYSKSYEYLTRHGLISETESRYVALISCARRVGGQQAPMAITGRSGLNQTASSRG